MTAERARELLAAVDGVTVGAGPAAAGHALPIVAQVTAAQWAAAARVAKETLGCAFFNFLTAIDYRTGKAAWKHKYPGSGSSAGMLATAGGVLFTGDGSGNFVAFDAANGKLLWHTRIGNISNAPQTFMVDGKQHVLVAVNDTLYAFRIY